MAKWILLSCVAGVLLSENRGMADHPVTTVRWSDLQQQQKLESGEVVRGDVEGREDADEELLITNDTGGPLTVRLFTLEPTEITAVRYQVAGTIRCEAVQQPGYLELWSHFPTGERYFTRTLSPDGPMGTIYGSAGSREFVLPFQRNPSGPGPSRLEVNLVLPANGKVWISPLSISELSVTESDLGMIAAGAWWGNQTGAFLGGGLGTFLGLLGAAVGILAGLGRGRPLVAESAG